MFNLFKSHIRTLLAVLLAFVIFITISFHVSAKQHYTKAYHVPTVKPASIFMLSFDALGNIIWLDVPEAVKLPVPVTANYLYIKDDAKPNNLNYQPVKRRSIGLINSQRNI